MTSQKKERVPYPPTSGDRDYFTAEELVVVLSRYDLGEVESIEDFPRGSRRAPKVKVVTNKGAYLLKRRAGGKNEPSKVAFAHALQWYLAENDFPLPHLIGTQSDNNSMLQWNGSVYEAFQYIPGTGYNNSLEATGHSGQILALFHQLAAEYSAEFKPPQGSYHDSATVLEAFKEIPRTLMRVEPKYASHLDQIETMMAAIQNLYRKTADMANEMGLEEWPLQIVHCDWHPGNMIFRDAKVVGVIDYDAARLQPRVMDVANGALQLSLLGGSEDLSKWPVEVDMPRFKRFLRGYDSVSVLSKAELRVIPLLMIEALIAESVIPIATTGKFANLEGLAFLNMIVRKVRWLKHNSQQIINALG